MKFSRTAIAVATTAALLGGGVALPHSPATAATSQAFLSGLTWPVKQVTPGGTVEIAPQGSIPSNVRFEGSDDYLGYRFSTNPRTGVVTMHVAEDVIPNQRTQFMITGSDGVRARSFPIMIHVVDTIGEMAKKYPLSYYPAFTVEDSSDSVLSVAQLQGDFPEGTRFEVTAPDHFKVTAAANGDLSVTQLDPVKPGSKSAASVKVMYPDGSFRNVRADIYAYSKKSSESLGSGASIEDFFNNIYDNAFTPKWHDKTMSGSEQASTALADALPEGTTFKARPDLNPSIFRFIDVDVDEASGVVVVKPKRPLTAPWTFQIPVEVTTPDNLVGIGWATFTVTEDGKWNSETFTVKYPAASATTTEIATAKPVGDFPEGTTFEINQTPPAGWQVKIDRHTGEINLTPPQRTRAGTTVTMPVTARFPDGSRTYLETNFTFIKPEVEQASVTTVRYPTARLLPGESVTVEPNNWPDGAVVSITNLVVRDLTFTADTSTGAITITAGKNADVAQIAANVVVTYKDGSQNTARLPIAIRSNTTTATQPSDAPGPGSPAPAPAPAPKPGTPSTANPAPAPAPAPTPGGTDKEGSSTGGIIAIVLGVLALLGAAGFAVTQMGSLPF